MDCNVFEKHRKSILAQMADNSILIEVSRNPEPESVVKQTYNLNRNYYYLCGVIEFENIVVLSKINGHDSEMIFINPYDEFKAKWTGAPLSKDEVVKISGIKNVRYLDTFNSVIERMISFAR